VKKKNSLKQAKADVESVWNNYLMGLITENERYNQVIDIWTRVNSRHDRDADEAAGIRSKADSTQST
jgi:DNA-directed RNA polymerase beta' subunit